MKFIVFKSCKQDASMESNWNRIGKLFPLFEQFPLSFSNFPLAHSSYATSETLNFPSLHEKPEKLEENVKRKAVNQKPSPAATTACQLCGVRKFSTNHSTARKNLQIVWLARFCVKIRHIFTHMRHSFPENEMKIVFYCALSDCAALSAKISAKYLKLREKSQFTFGKSEKLHFLRFFHFTPSPSLIDELDFVEFLWKNCAHLFRFLQTWFECDIFLRFFVA